MKRFVVPKNLLILYKIVNTRAIAFKKNYGSGGGALKYPITRLIRVVWKSGFRCFAPLLILVQMM